MRRFFFFKSNSYDDNSKTPTLPASKINYENLTEGDAAFSGSRTPDESRSRYADEQDFSSPRLRRSLSFSSPTPFDYTDQFDSNLSQNFSGSPRIYQNPSLSDCPNHRHFVKPDRHPISRNGPNDNHYYDLSSSDSPIISSVPVRCQSSHFTNIPNKNSFLDVYIEGEQRQEETGNPLEENQSTFSDTKREADSLSRKMSALGLGKPPRPRSRGSDSFREAKDLESETTSSVEDIYEDTSEARAFSSNALANVYDVDEALMRKAREADEILARFSKENFESDRLKLKGVTAKSLLTIIQEINEDRKHLALELSTQIKSRLAERFDLKEKYRNSRLELDAHMRQLEMEKNALQLDQERELDWHSNDWSVKLSKYELEEKRLRDRVRELAEQNVALQRELSSLKSREGEIQAKNVDYEAQLDQVRKENLELKQSLTEVTESFKVAVGQLGHFQTSYKEKEEEARALHKTVHRLQRTCTDQEKSINSLRHDKNPSNKDSWYHTEISRLTGVEQNLRREVESCRAEIEALRRENISFLERLNKGKNGNGYEFVRLEEEIRQRVECLQGKGLCLLNECSRVCSGLLKCMRNRNRENFEGLHGNEERYSLIQYTLKCESIKKGVEGLKRSLQCVSSVLDEKLVVEKSNEYSERQHMNNPAEVELEEQLKSETMINKILRENLFSKEKEIVQLQEEVASLVRGGELLQSEIQRMQGEISFLTYRTKDMEIQTGKKEERINQLQEELQDTVKELTATRSMLKTAMEERDVASHEVAHLQKANKDLTDDISFLHKRVELLDEDLLFKDGQISILKDKPQRSVF
ncbi:uncharacterized protein LOC144547341 isoform X1 [Carex rostrata]